MTKNVTFYATVETVTETFTTKKSKKEIKAGTRLLKPIKGTAPYGIIFQSEKVITKVKFPDNCVVKINSTFDDDTEYWNHSVIHTIGAVNADYLEPLKGTEYFFQAYQQSIIAAQKEISDFHVRIENDAAPTILSLAEADVDEIN